MKAKPCTSKTKIPSKKSGFLPKTLNSVDNRHCSVENKVKSTLVKLLIISTMITVSVGMSIFFLF